MNRIPKFAFCGYPVTNWRFPLTPQHYQREHALTMWHPCGNIATPGCAYCDFHANAKVDDVPLTADEIVWRAEQREQRLIVRWFLIAAFVVLLALTEPLHAWLRVHLHFLFGVVAGSVLQGIAWAVWRWRKGDRP